MAKKSKEPKIEYIYKATILKAFDGDTFTARVDLGLGFTGTQQFNLANADAHELRGESLAAGRKAKKEVEDLMVGKEVIIRTHRTKLKGRYAATVEIDGKDLGEELLKKGHAKPVNNTGKNEEESE